VLDGMKKCPSNLKMGAGLRNIVHSSSRVEQHLFFVDSSSGAASVDFPTAIVPGILSNPNAVGLFCM
jgi:hypothetical protein